MRKWIIEKMRKLKHSLIQNLQCAQILRYPNFPHFCEPTLFSEMEASFHPASVSPGWGSSPPLRGFPNLAIFLPKPGIWMNYIKYFLGICYIRRPLPACQSLLMHGGVASGIIFDPKLCNLCFSSFP